MAHEKFDKNLRESTQSSDIDLSERRVSNFAIGDSEEWIRNNIIRQTMALKVRFFGRLGMGSKPLESMSKEMIKKLLSPDEDNMCRVERKLSEMKDLRMGKSYRSPDGDISLNFFFRSDDEFRHDYYNRLIGMKVMKPQPARKHQDIIVFDWDDTLLCTGFVTSFGFELCDLPSVAVEMLKPLDEIASKILKKAVDSGRTFIITNAMEGWVENSSHLYLPKVHEVLMTENICIISARTENEKFFPIYQWKINAFMSLKKYFDPSLITNIICVGDSPLEIESANILSQGFSKSILKTIKMKENPSPIELVNELNLIDKKYENIYSEIRNLTITLEKRERNPNEAAVYENKQFPQVTPMTSTA